MPAAAPPPELRLCKNCKFADRAGKAAEQWICTHATSYYQPPRNLVTGEMPKRYQLRCFQARDLALGKECGSNGRYWQPIPLAAEIAA
jgi:hypothetical protein